MGRSQVKYNRTHGRPGTKGRGAGRSSSAREQQHKPQGDNAWRYNDSSAARGGDVDLEQVLELETQRMPKYSDTQNVEEGLLVAREINVSAMGRALNQLSVAERLRIPARLTVDLEVKNVSTSSVKMENAPSAAATSKRGHSGSDVAGAVTSQSHDKIEHPDEPLKDPEVDAHADDDLDAWLDSVIT